ILRAARRLDGGPSEPSGVYHLSGGGDVNWSGLARHVLEASRALGGPHAAVRDIATADYPTRARRPANSRLSSDKFAVAFGWRPPDWRGSAEQVVRRILHEDCRVVPA
ncbi:MAG: sugar nucleotide-binding protein, partial [Rhizobiaceae bacterium]|nr:sugar nucleotide-binding protein [Rhizobiaceae bacterium]